MSAAEFQKRIADLKFSAEEHLRALQKEQDASEQEHQDWEDDEGNDELEMEEPEVIDNSNKIAHIETAIGHLETAIEELDGALDE